MSRTYSIQAMGAGGEAQPSRKNSLPPASVPPGGAHCG
jgi:hypothetical protein